MLVPSDFYGMAAKMRLMAFQSEKQYLFTKELTSYCPLLAAFGGSSGGREFLGAFRPQTPYFSP